MDNFGANTIAGQERDVEFHKDPIFALSGETIVSVSKRMSPEKKRSPSHGPSTALAPLGTKPSQCATIKPYSIESANARQLASIIFVLAPTVLQREVLLRVSINTRVIASVP